MLINRTIALFLLVAVTAGLIQGQSAQAKRPNKVEVEIKQIEAERSRAIKEKDFTTLDRIYADDFNGTAANGRVVNKQQLFEVFKNSDPRLSFSVSEIVVRVFQNTVVVNGRLTASNAENKILGSSRFMHLYVKRDRRWQFVAGQSTNIQ